VRRNDFILHSSRPATGCVFSALLSAHLDAMDVVHQTVEDAIRDGAIADLLVPARDRQLRSEDRNDLSSETHIAPPPGIYIHLPIYEIFGAVIASCPSLRRCLVFCEKSACQIHAARSC